MKQYLKAVLTCLTIINYAINKSGALLEEMALQSILKTECTTLFFDLKREFIRTLIELHQDSSYTSEGAPLVQGTFFTADKRTFSLAALKEPSKCTIAISHSSMGEVIQKIILPTYKRQLLLLNDNSTHEEFEIKVHKFNHPIAIFDSKGEQMHQDIVCRNGQKLKANLYDSGQWNWVLPFTINSMTFERMCNKGEHPLHGKVLKGSLFAIKPFLLIDESTYGITGGVAYDILRTIAQYYGFNYDAKFAHQVFVIHGNGTLGGALGELVYGQVDFSLEQGLVVGQQFGRFTTYTYHLFLTFFEQKPRKLPRYTNIAYPLDRYTWILILISLLSVWLALAIIYKINSGTRNTTKGIIRNFEMFFGIMFQEYYLSNNLKCGRLPRIFIFMWIAATTFLSMAFTGNLKSSLVRKNFEERTMTLGEMVDKDMTIFMTDTLENYLASDITDSVLNSRMLCQGRKKDSFYPIDADYFNNAYEPVLKHGGASGLFEQSIQVLKNSYLKDGKDFPFVIIPEWYMMMAQGVLFQKFDPRAEYFDPVINSLKDNGLVDFYFAKLMPPKNMVEKIVPEEEPLILEHFFLPLLIWSIGLSICFFSYVFEKCLKYY